MSNRELVKSMFSRNIKLGNEWKSKISYKLFFTLFLVISFILILLVYFSTSNNTVKKHVYFISITHKGQPIENTLFSYGMFFYDNSSICPEHHSASDVVQSSNYTFDSDTKIANLSLKFYENKNYVFELEVQSNLSGLYMSFLSVDSKDTTLNYYELPKLSRDFSINFDIPFFNKTKTSTSFSNGSTIIHTELVDDWSSNATFSCRLSRIYDSQTDSKLPKCDLISNSSDYRECNTRFFSCGSTIYVFYKIPASVSGKNIDCLFLSKNLISGKIYDLRIVFNEPIDKNLFKFFRSNSLSVISVP